MSFMETFRWLFRQPRLPDLPFPFDCLIHHLTPEQLMRHWRRASRRHGTPVLLLMNTPMWDVLATSATATSHSAHAFAEYMAQMFPNGIPAELIGDSRDGSAAVHRFLSFDRIGDLSVLLATIPVEKPWQIFRLLPFGGWNSCPPADVAEDFLREVYEQWGAVPAAVSGGTLELVPTRKPTISEACELARRMYAFCPDIVEQGTGSILALADSLTKSDVWYFWWD